MKCVVPLAGPDLWSEKLGFRPLYDLDGTPLIEAALKPRAWAGKLAPSDYVFVLRAVEGLEVLASYLRATWPGCRIVTLSELTGGALYSVLAAMALVGPDEHVIVDLADILFSTGPADPAAMFAAEGHGAIVPVFTSSDSCYSYLTLARGLATGAREKQVISDHASAGVYMFRDMQMFLRAAAHSVDNRAALSFRDVLFICPMVNGVIAEGMTVAAPDIGTCRPVSKVFHG